MQRAVRDPPTLRSLIDPHDLKLLESRRPADRRVAVEALGRVGDGHAIELLTASLRDPDVDVMFEAAKMLAQIGDDRAADGLLSVASDEACPVVRRVVAVGALGDVTAVPERAVAALHRLARGRDSWLHSAAKAALVRLMRY
ncbi:MAG: HEAT repeat domain-containing protein [Polyangiaceae bacterium]